MWRVFRHVIQPNTTMSNIAQIHPETATPEITEVFANVKKAMGMVPNLVATLAQSSAAMHGYLAFDGALAKGSLPSKYREVISVVVAHANGCNYCLSAHSMVAKMKGYTEDQVLDFRRGKSADSKEQSMITFIHKVLAKKGNVSADDIQELRSQGFSESDIVEIIANVALNIFTNYFNNAADTVIDFPLAPALEA
jgi:uncharacterized peroxidase-related enzyme